MIFTGKDTKLKEIVSCGETTLHQVSVGFTVQKLTIAINGSEEEIITIPNRDYPISDSETNPIQIPNSVLDKINNADNVIRIYKSCFKKRVSFNFQSPDQLRTHFQSTEDNFRDAVIRSVFVSESDIRFRISNTSDFSNSTELSFLQLVSETGLNGKFIEISVSSLDSNFDGGGYFEFPVSVIEDPFVLTLNIDEKHPDNFTAIPVTKDMIIRRIESTTNDSEVLIDLSANPSSDSDWLHQTGLLIPDLELEMSTMQEGEVRFLRPYFKWTNRTPGNFGGQVEIEISNPKTQIIEHAGNFNIINGDYRTQGQGNAWQGGGSRYLQCDNFVEFDSDQPWSALFVYYTGLGVDNRLETPVISTNNVSNFLNTGITIRANAVQFAAGDNPSNMSSVVYENLAILGKVGFNACLITYTGLGDLSGVSFHLGQRRINSFELNYSGGNTLPTGCTPNLNICRINTISSSTHNQTIGYISSSLNKHTQMVNRVLTNGEIREALSRWTMQGIVDDAEFLIAPNYDKPVGSTDVPSNLVAIAGSDSRNSDKNHPDYREQVWRTIGGVSYTKFYK